MITVRIWGGLGNQMFQYAYARALRARTKQEVFIDKQGVFRESLEMGIIRDYALDCFKITLTETPDIMKKYSFLERNSTGKRLRYELAARRIISPWLYIEKDEGFVSDLYDFEGDMYLQGWFQNERYFCDYREIILKEFELKHKYNIDNELSDILKNEQTVSVHIRRGDYKSLNFALPLDYQKAAIEYMEQKYDDPFFLFFSDDVEWVKSNMNMPKKYRIISGGEYRDYEEMNLMSRCKNNIIANSTFSWWGAWLNNNNSKIVIAPKNWMRLKEPLSIVPQEWVVL